MEIYKAEERRYDEMTYRRCGASGLRVPVISIGLWHNFGHADSRARFSEIAFRAFDRGITHFDLANNYGPPPGSAEENFGKLLRGGLKPYRDQLLVSTKAGYPMWPGPYGNGGSRKYLMASIHQSLRRTGLEYVDIFYSHRPDPDTPLEETVAALSDIVRQGKALHVAISNYPPPLARQAIAMLRDAGTPCLVHQAKYSMFERAPECGLLQTLADEGVGLIAFSPLAQGLLTDRYLDGIPAGSRAARPEGFLQPGQVTPERVEKARRLNALASARGQSLAAMALAWLLRNPVVTSVLIGASSPEQIDENLKALQHLDFSQAELDAIEEILATPAGE
ncbi:MAG: aldo/keto reductase [Odoribacteraceae bacterium]|jgi:L-glyceraldehyde 3-phosphate reductase|nr:aldo/keto reductase [Odoribacteraceae bacterium]